MQVRGAPAIAIVAALSLAVELHELQPELEKQTGAEVARTVEEKLAYLVKSRPTAVNLADAAEKLRAVVQKVVSEGGKGKDVVHAYCEAAERMMVTIYPFFDFLKKRGMCWIAKLSSR